MKQNSNPQRLLDDGTQAVDLRHLLHEIGNRIHVIAGRTNRLRNKLEANEVAEHNLSIILDQCELASKSLEKARCLLVPEGREDASLPMAFKKRSLEGGS